MPPVIIPDYISLPAAIFLWWAVTETLISGMQRREQRRMASRERMMVMCLWPLFLTIGAVVLFGRSLRR